jgi:predicted deacylase
MKSGTLHIGSVQVKVGEKKSFTQTIELDGTQVELPVFVINGVKDGPRLVITGGIHGAEYASVEAALQIGRSLQPEDLSGQVIILPVANMPAFKARSIYVCPLDGINLNRVFPGKPDGGKTAQLAHWIFQNAIKDADYYIDMHGGDLVEALAPFTIMSESGNAETDAKSLKLAEVFGIRDIVKSKSQGSTIAGAAGAGVPAILTEAGGQGIWTKESIFTHTDGAKRVMRWLKMIAGEQPTAVTTRMLNQFIWLASEHTGYYYATVEIGDTVKKGQNIGMITNFEGSVLQEVIAPEAGEVLFLVSSLSINEGDPLLSIGAE